MRAWATRGAALVGPWSAILLAGAWVWQPHPFWLFAASLAVVAQVFAPSPVGSGAGGRAPLFRAHLGRIVLLALVAGGLWAHGRDRALAQDFARYWDLREAEVFSRLDAELTNLLDRGVEAAHTLAAAAAAGNPPDHRTLARLRSESGLAGLALYDPVGGLQVWDGLHRGRVPDEVKSGTMPYFYGERPLVSYLYLAESAPDGSTGVAAVLLRADLPTAGGGQADFASRIRDRTGETLRISSAGRAPEGEVFDLTWEGETLFSVSLERPTPSVRRRALMDRVRLRAFGGCVLAWLLLATGRGAGPRAGRFHRGGALVAAVGLALLAPVNLLPGLSALASPADVLVALPGSGGLSLARLLLLLAALVVAAGASRSVAWPKAGAAGLLLVAVGMPVLVLNLHGAASAGFLAGRESHWLAFALLLAGALSLVAWLALVVSRAAGPRRVRVALGVGLAAALALVVARVLTHQPGIQPWWLVAWTVPVHLLRVGGPREGRFGTVLSWVLAIVVGTSAALPQAWGGRLEARRLQAETEVARLGTGVDPYLQFLLGRTAATVTALDDEGVSPVELLYRGWRASGLADEGYPVWFTLWSAGDVPQEELRVGFGSRDRPAVADAFLPEVREGDSIQVRRFEHADAHYLMLAPLSGGRVVSAVVPPLVGSAGGAGSLLGPLFGSLAREGDPPLTLIPLLPDEEPSLDPSIRWVHSRGAWLGEMALRYPGAAYHAHYEIPLPGTPVLVARGALVLAGVAAVLALFWMLGRHLAVGEGGLGELVRLAFTSFRARVTFALFAFFALSNLIFGGLAYRTIDGASQRAARVLSERAVNDAANTYLEVQGEMRLLARRVGADLVEYRGGELRDGSVEELIALGLYEGWVPYAAHEALSSRESLLEVATTELGAWEYVTAYRRLPDGDVLGAPVPLQAGAAAVQSREIAHLLGFAVLAGAGLSFLLALLVGRTLTRPIQTLKVASERVGAGNLGVRLQHGRPDEFGAVFDAFNRMVRRLRRARRELVRVNRRTRAVVEDVATGVVAFDRAGVVTLVNPRARALLGLSLVEGQRPERGPGVGGEFVRWVELYFRDRLEEASTEFQAGPRRIRARARRIGGLGPTEPREPSGAVVSLEDVTDELRTERVLAWGEMARQVAHEVKNPLTPIKLSVQHLRRAWDDGRSDFGDILQRNADAMLREIDRLAGIASGFARFGAPEAPGEEPLEAVPVDELVHEVMALYASGEGPVRFESRVPPSLPPVQARTQELKEVLVNLLENARAAVRDQGRVVVEAGVEGEGDDERVVLTVVDDGVGIPAAVLPRIFEPHFSTRSTGTGLGLAIVQRLVEGWGGSVSAESTPGRSTVLAVRLRIRRPTAA
jgi:two-component system, NtrC family, nitrogen regulation sensor histidine kinase NtrY